MDFFRKSSKILKKRDSQEREEESIFWASLSRNHESSLKFDFLTNDLVNYIQTRIEVEFINPPTSSTFRLGHNYVSSFLNSEDSFKFASLIERYCRGGLLVINIVPSALIIFSEGTKLAIRYDIRPTFSPEMADNDIKFIKDALDFMSVTSRHVGFNIKELIAPDCEKSISSDIEIKTLFSFNNPTAPL